MINWPFRPPWGRANARVCQKAGVGGVPFGPLYIYSVLECGNGGDAGPHQ